MEFPFLSNLPKKEKELSYLKLTPIHPKEPLPVNKCNELKKNG